MKSVNIQYFALLRDQAGKDSEKIQVSCKTYADLYNELSTKYQFSLPLKVIQVAVNDEFAKLTQEITDDARIVFIPPVAGG